MAQIGFLVIAGALVVGGVLPLLGRAKSKRKTHPGVAAAMILIGVALAVFSVAVLPRL